MRRIMLMSLMLAAAGAQAQSSSGPDLCLIGETLYFNCVTAKQKSISLCGSPDLTAADAYLQYRFGKPGSAELLFPATKQNSLKKFQYAHYFRPQTDRFWLGFTNAGYRYSIFMNAEAPAPSDAGVWVVTPEGKEGEVKCATEPELKADELEKVLECNNEELAEMGCAPVAGLK